MRQQLPKDSSRQEDNCISSSYELSNPGVDPGRTVQTQASVLELERQKRNKEELDMKKEQNMTIMIGIILVIFLVCTIPGSLVIQLDPTAVKYTNVGRQTLHLSL